MSEIKSTFFVVEKESFINKVSLLTRRYKVEVTMDWKESFVETYKTEEDEFKYNVYPVEVTFSFAEFKIEGYQYLGCIKDEERMGFFTIHGNDNVGSNDIEEFIKSFDNIPCTACNRKHSRKIGHLFLKEDTKEINIFGSACAKKYFGINFDRVLSFYETFNTRFNEWEDEFKGEYFSNFCSVEKAIKYTWHEISTSGYISSAKAYELDREPTSFYVKQSLLSKDITTSVKESIKEATKNLDINKVLEKVYEGKGDFIHNMNTIVAKLNEGIVNYKDIGFITYLVYDVYFKAPVREKIEYILPEGVNEGDVVRDIEVELVSKNYFETRYGYMTVNVFVDNVNCVKYKWISNVDVACRLDIEELPAKVLIKRGTIKKLEDHVTYGKSINLNRVKVEAV